MPNPFAIAGGIPERTSKYAPLLVNRFWSGQYSNSNPLAEPTVPYLYQRFYSASRYEVIRSGSNIEISPRLTLIRRPGLSVYNSQTFAPCTTFYSFRVFNYITQQTQIRVIADTATAVYDATGPSTKTLLWTKLSGAGQTSFQSVGNTLYAADGVSNWKWVWFPGWASATTFTTGNSIIDSNQSIETLTGIQFFPTNPGQTVTVLGNVGTIVWGGGILVGLCNWTDQQLTELPGTTITLSGFTSATFLNATTATITSVYNVNTSLPFAISGRAFLTFAVSHADYGPTADSGSVVGTVGSGTSGNSTPSWSTTIGGTATDSALIWTNKGPAAQLWGITAPIAAPSVANTFIPNGNAWVASTFYWPTPVIVDPNSNIQLLTTDGTTAATPPAFNVSGTTADGTAVWTFQGQAARQTSTAYALGSFIAVTVTTTYTITTRDPGARGSSTVETFTSTNYLIYKATNAGTSSSAATGSISWPQNLGGTVTDGSVIWQNCGYQVNRTNVATSVSPASNTKGTVANSQKVTQINNIVDNVSSGGGTGFGQTVTLAGASGAAHPTWTTSGGVESTGLYTNDNGLYWKNTGPVGAANTAAWVYGFAFMNSVTGHISSMSPATSPILLAAQSGISISGNGDPNWATDGVDTIVIYRTVQGFTSPLFQLTTIPAAAQGQPWSYLDVSPDPPNPTAILNEFISADTVGNNAPPPAGLTNLTYYLNRVFGSVGVFQDYSGVAGQTVGVGAESWKRRNFMQMPESITRSWPSATGLLIFTLHGVFYSQGVDSNGNPNTPVQLLEDIGLLSTNLFTVNGSIPTLLTSDGQMLGLSPETGITRYSDPIADSTSGMGGFSTTSSYLTWHVNGTDTAFYLADGSTGWFRMCPTAAPESGFTWSPKANITGGCGAIKSIETSPGVKNLLVSPTSSGNILKRDLTTYADNGTAYTANCVIGSLVLAQPTQCAEVECISTFATAVGSKVTVSVLGNEISGSFEALPTSVPEPPFLATASSTYSDRWYFAELQQPGWLQHMQLKFSWPAENAANELLAYVVFGCVHLLD